MIFSFLKKVKNDAKKENMEFSRVEKERTYIELIIQTFPDSGTAQIVPIGSEMLSGTESPVIGFHFRNGKYLLRIGDSDKIIESSQLSLELKQLLINDQTMNQRRRSQMR